MSYLEPFPIYRDVIDIDSDMPLAVFILTFSLLLRPGRGAEYCDQFVCLSAWIGSAQKISWRSPVAVAQSSAVAYFRFLR